MFSHWRECFVWKVDTVPLCHWPTTKTSLFLCLCLCLFIKGMSLKLTQLCHCPTTIRTSFLVTEGFSDWSPPTISLLERRLFFIFYMKRKTSFTKEEYKALKMPIFKRKTTYCSSLMVLSCQMIMFCHWQDLIECQILPNTYNVGWYWISFNSIVHVSFQCDPILIKSSSVGSFHGIQYLQW